MLPNQFQLYVISRGLSGLYRTLLSIWKLDEYPNLVHILTNSAGLEIAHKTINTVVEDTSLSGPTVKLTECIRNWQTELLHDLNLSQYLNQGIIVERDMILPAYIDLFKSEHLLPKSFIIPYRQRQKFGNSKQVIVRSSYFQKKFKRLPLAVLLLHKKDIKYFIENVYFYENFEFSIDKKNFFEQNILNNDSAKVLVQSNIKSPFESN